MCRHSPAPHRTSFSSRSKRRIPNSMQWPHSSSSRPCTRVRWCTLTTNGHGQNLTRSEVRGQRSKVRNELTLANSSLEKTGAKRRTTPLTFYLLPLTLGVLVSAGCRQDMHDAPRYDPYESSAIFRNESSAQPLVAGTEPRTDVAGAVLDEDELLNTGKQAGQLANVFPFAITRADIDRGE